ncbi:alpha/beta hydrolase family protein [Paenibacillus sp. GXUN7292]|uniref:alpha/beta hydrolase family protein n=1 Tax=Paenibacillus sp. GXUN7292 TaxID=3422499 RepID=UPI003D7C6116
MMERIKELEHYICTLYETKDQLRRHIYKRADQAFEAGDEQRDRIDNCELLEERRQAMKRAFVKSIGGLPPSDTPLNAAVVNVVAAEGYRIENIVFESRPGEYVTGNLYLPRQLVEVAPAVLFLSGHDAQAKHSIRYHEVCLRMVQAGLVVFAIDPIGQGERLSLLRNSEGEEVWGTAEHQRLGIQCHALGQSVARYFVHDAMRAVDYLAMRPEVDPTRIGVTGNSGGGTQTAMMMVCDDRIAAAAPATFIMNRQQYMHAGGVQDAEQIWPGLSGLGFDHEDLLLAFAPKPLLVCAVKYDFFPIEATRRTVQRCRRFWEMSGQGEGLRLVEDEFTHSYTDVLAIAAADFFTEHLLEQGDAERDAYRSKAQRSKLAPLASEQLQCTRSGQVMREYADAKAPSDTFSILAAELAEARTAARDEQSAAASEWLKRIVLTDRERCELNPRFIQMPSLAGLNIKYALWWSQPEVMNSGYLFSPDCGTDDASGSDLSRATIAIALWQDGTKNLVQWWNWIQSMCASGRTVLVLNVSAVGPHEPHLLYGKPNDRFFGMTHKLADELIWLGDSLAALRIYDVLRAADFAASLCKPDDCQIELYAAGLFRIYAELAIKLDERLQAGKLPGDAGSIRLSEWLAQGVADERDVMSVIIPGILQYYDLQIDKR